MGLKIKGAYSAILSKKSLKDKKNPRNGKKSMNGKNHSQLIKTFLNWYTFYQFWFKICKKGSSDQEECFIKKRSVDSC